MSRNAPSPLPKKRLLASEQNSFAEINQSQLPLNFQELFEPNSLFETCFNQRSFSIFPSHGGKVANQHGDNGDPSSFFQVQNHGPKCLPEACSISYFSRFYFPISLRSEGFVFEHRPVTSFETTFITFSTMWFLIGGQSITVVAILDGTPWASVLPTFWEVPWGRLNCRIPCYSN